MPTKICCIENCGSPAKARGLCNKHYKRECRRLGGALPPIGHKHCSVQNCKRLYYAKGYCSLHYQEAFRRKMAQSRVEKNAVVNLPNEQWRDIPGYEGEYQVSNLGRVKRVEHTLVRANGHIMLYHERLPKLKTDEDGYLSVALCHKGKIKYERVHRLVAGSFLDNHNNLPQVNHKNGIKNDNRVANLEWCSASSNIRHRIYKLGVLPSMVPRKILCVETGETFDSISKASRKYNIAVPNMVAVLRKNKYHHTAGGFHWKYIS